MLLTNISTEDNNSARFRNNFCMTSFNYYKTSDCIFNVWGAANGLTETGLAAEEVQRLKYVELARVCILLRCSG